MFLEICAIEDLLRLIDVMNDEKRILRYLEGTASKNTQLELIEWKGASSKNLKEFRRFKFIWEATLRLKNYVQYDLTIEWSIFQSSSGQKL